jgi:hypothetical protein
MTLGSGAPYRVSVYDRQGMKKDEIDATFHCVWIANDIGKANFTISVGDPKCTADNLQFGNYVLFEHAQLPNWAGVISPHDPRKWSGDKQVTVQLLSAEYQFSRRRAPGGGRLEGTPGAIFTRVCQWANMGEDALIRFGGSIWMDGPIIPVDIANQKLSTIMGTVTKSAQVEWWLDPQIDPTTHRLIFNANLSQQRGTNNGYVLKEGFNIESPQGDFYMEEGDIINDDAVMGSAATIDARPLAIAQSPNSIGKYGLWQESEVISSGDAGGAQNVANTKMNTNAEPTGKFLLTAIDSDESGNTFALIGVGDVVLVDLYSVGFYAGLTPGNGITATTRILSEEYATDENKLVLVNQVVNV